jgi:hypothetical protein
VRWLTQPYPILPAFDAIGFGLEPHRLHPVRVKTTMPPSAPVSDACIGSRWQMLAESSTGSEPDYGEATCYEVFHEVRDRRG